MRIPAFHSQEVFLKKVITKIQTSAGGVANRLALENQPNHRALYRAARKLVEVLPFFAHWRAMLVPFEPIEKRPS